MCWTPWKLLWMAFGLFACGLWSPEWLPLVAGVGAFEMGCGCGCETPESACEICCNNGVAYTVSVTIPDGVFASDGTFCTPCQDLDDLEVFMDNFTVIDPCDWLFVDVENVCGGSSTSRSFSMSIRESGGTCTITFRYTITCDGFVSYYDWETTFSDGSECSTLNLPYKGDLSDGICCNIVGSPPDVIVSLNP